MLDEQCQNGRPLFSPELLTIASRRKKAGIGSLLSRSSCAPDDPVGDGTELNPVEEGKWPGRLEEDWEEEEGGGKRKKREGTSIATH